MESENNYQENNHQARKAKWRSGRMSLRPERWKHPKELPLGLALARVRQKESVMTGGIKYTNFRVGQNGVQIGTLLVIHHRQIT